MTEQILTAAKNALANNSLYSLFLKEIGRPEDIENEDTTSYALMFNTETSELFFLDYATNENNWNKTAEQQHPWITIGFVSATDILMGDPASELSDKLDYEYEQQQQIKSEL